MSSTNAEKASGSQTFSRRDVLWIIGAGAVSLVQGAGGGNLVGELTARTVQRATRRQVNIAADPAAITIDLSATAVIVVDMQNDFVSKGGMLDGLGADIGPIQRALAPTAKVLSIARNTGFIVIYLKMAFRPDLSDLGPPQSPNWIAHQHAGVGNKVRTPDGSDGRILIRDTWNTDVVETLKPEPSDIQIYKHRYSGFFETDLDAILKRRRIRYLIITGCTTSVCVESTIRDAMFRDYSAILLADCTAEPLGNDLARSNHEASLFVISGRNFGWVSSSGDFIKSVQQSAS